MTRKGIQFIAICVGAAALVVIAAPVAYLSMNVVCNYTDSGFDFNKKLYISLTATLPPSPRLPSSSQMDLSRDYAGQDGGQAG